MASLGIARLDSPYCAVRRRGNVAGRDSSRRRRRPTSARRLGLECLEDRILLSVTAAGVEESLLPVTGVAAGADSPAIDTAVCSSGLLPVSREEASGTPEAGPRPVPSPAMVSELSAASMTVLSEIGNGKAQMPAVLLAAKPNLAPYRPVGWSGKIVVSNVTGTNTDTSAFAYTDTLYVDWAAINNGTAATDARFYIELYVDGLVKNTWYQEPPLGTNTYTQVSDFSIGQLSAGKHTIQVKLDTTTAVAESNEKDNTYTKTIMVRKPNLAPYKPAGWSDKIVVSNVAGTHTNSSPLASNETLYVDWAAISNGKVPVAARFYIELYVDGSLRNTWYQDPPLGANTYTQVSDFSIGQLSAGKHTIQVKLDTTAAVLETSETDNVYTKTITVKAPVMKPNLTPYRPSGWSDPIVVSTVTGTTTDAGSLTTNDTVYIDWAVLNQGNTATSARFVSGLYVDGTLRQSWYTDPPLNPGYYAYVTDCSLGTLSAGRHTIQIRIDSGRTVAEINENDNVYTKTITVASAPSYVRFVADYRDGAGEGFNDPTLGAQRRAAFQYALGIWSNLLPSAYAGETITVEAYFDPLGGTPFGAELAHAGPNSVRWNFGGRSLANTVYGDPLANHLRGADLAKGQDEIVATFNSDVDGSYVLGSIGFYYGTDGNCGRNMDLVSIVLHELGHGLNFLGAFDPSGGSYYYGYPAIYDRFLERGNGADLTAMDNAGRATAAVSNDLYWSGARGASGNGGVRPKMYAPASIQPGSSIAHTDETLYPNDLMSPMYSGPDHTPGSMDLGILADMGWSIASGSSSATPLTTTFDESPGPGGSAPFDRWIEEQYVLPQAPASTLSPVLAPRSSPSDFLAAVAADRNGLGAAERIASGPGQEVFGGRWSADSARRQFTADEWTYRQDERDNVTASLPQVARATTLQAMGTMSSRGALIDSVFAAGSSSSLSSDLAIDLSDLRGNPPRAGFAGRSASDT